MSLSLLDAQLQHIVEIVQTVAGDLATDLEVAVELPERQYITMGGAIYDCEQLSVAANSISPNLPGNQSVTPTGLSSCADNTPWGTDIDIAIVRKSCHGMTGRRGTIAPTPEQYLTDAHISAVDTEILRRTAVALAAPIPTGYGMLIGQILNGAAQGGLMATVLTLSSPLFPPASN